jgi:hypothetical protein
MSCLVFFYPWSGENSRFTSENRSLVRGVLVHGKRTVLHVASSMSRSLYPGELPGYTGWPRPATTLAGSFEIVRPCKVNTKVSTNWTCSVHCSHELCNQGGSLFYLRAYGPAIIPGLVADHLNGTYDFTFLPLDEGRYTVEVVLTFSHPPPFSVFPLEKFTEPLYEGYMLLVFHFSYQQEIALRIRQSLFRTSLYQCVQSRTS